MNDPSEFLFFVKTGCYTRRSGLRYNVKQIRENERKRELFWIRGVLMAAHKVRKAFKMHGHNKISRREEIWSLWSIFGLTECDIRQL